MREGNIFQTNRPAEFLEKLGEDELIEKVVIPLFQRYNWHLVKRSKHREGELGKDLVFKAYTDFGPIYYAIQTKAEKINNSNVLTVIKQIGLARSSTVIDISEEAYVSFVFVITSKNITNDAEKVLKDELKKSPYVRFFDKEKLLGMIIKVMNEKPLIFLKPIDEILNRKNSHGEGFIWFRGPIKEDFDKKDIIERTEVHQIIQSINDGNNAILVLGAPASGKTVLAYNIAYYLLKDKKGFLINASDITKGTISSIITEIESIISTKPLLIIEDIHKNPVICNSLYRTLNRYIQNKKMTVIITSRPGYKIDFPRLEYNYILDLENKPYVTLFSITSNSIIKPLIEKRLGKKSDIFHKKIAEECGGDLWILTYFLSSIKNDKIDMEQVLQYIHKDLVTIERDIPNTLQIMLTLSFFYRYEIQIEKKYLTNLLDIGYDIISALLREGYIIEDPGKDYCFVRHSSIAELFVATGRKFKSISKICKLLKMTEDDVEKLLFEDYIKFDPSMIYLFVQRFRYNNELLEFLITTNSTRRIIFDKINNLQEENELIASFLSDFTRISSEKVRHEVERQINEKLYAKRINKEKDLETIGCLLNCLPWDISPIGKTLIDESNIAVEKMRRRYRRDRDEKMGYCDWNIKWDIKKNLINEIRAIFQKYKSGKKINLETMDLNHLAFCSKLSHARYINVCSKSLLCEASLFYRKMLRSVDVSKLANKIDKETDLYKISHILNNLYWLDKSIGYKLMILINMKTLAKKISNAQSVDNLSFLFWNLEKLLDKENLDVLKNSITNNRIKKELSKYGSF